MTMKPPRVFIGIDPGKSGGLATLSLDGDEAQSTPDSLEDQWGWFKWWSDRADVLIYMEQVGGFIGTRPTDDGGIGDGAKRNLASAHTMFKFGLGVGHLEAFIEAAGLTGQLTMVPPRKWQAEFGIQPKGKKEPQTEFKNRIKAKAQELFPDLKVTLHTADALLIALYGKRLYERT